MLQLIFNFQPVTFFYIGYIFCKYNILATRAVRYDDIYRMDEIKSLSFHIMFYRLFHGVAKYIVYGNTRDGHFKQK